MAWQDDDVATEKLAPGARAGPVRLIAFLEGAPVVYDVPRRGELTLGRADDADLVVADPSVSRAHARLRIGERLTLIDLDSANGTRVGECALSPGEPFELGHATAFELGRVTVLVDRATERSNESAEPGIDPRLGAPGLRALARLIAKTAPTRLNVLVNGETGAGKEVVAEAVHDASQRRGPLVKLNCAAFSPTLLESELFGHARGAFTGAERQKTGLLVKAAGGTVFLDEIGDMPIELQPKLLRVIEDRRVLPVGQTEPIPIDVRFVSATHKPLGQAITAGSFRADLYYRLNGITLTVPPLRERREEIAALSHRFIAGFGASVALSEGALRTLHAHSWPGNIRELKNVIERACAVAQGEVIEAEDLLLSETLDAPDDAMAALEGEEAQIEAALRRFGGNQTKAARHLGISRSTLVRRLNAYGFSRPKK